MSDVVLYVLVPLIALLVLAGAVMWVRRPDRDELAPGPPATPLDLQEHIRELCARGRRMQAIKVLREAHPGLRLVQAKQMVDVVAAGGPLTLPRAQTPGRLPPALHAEVLRLGEQRKIQAIKLVRDELPGVHLKHAKDLVESVLRGAPPAVESAGTPALGADLADRVRGLVAEGRREQAVLLVREQTGMAEDEATAFVDAVEPRTGTG